jgi:DNA-binding response OmpR family regulator
VADEYITKPFEPLELLERVATVIARNQAGASGGGASAAAGAPD